MKNKTGAAAPKREVRLHTTPQRIEIRTNADGSRSISGYAATFNSLSEDLGSFKEKIAPGAFKQSLKESPDVLCLYGHDNNQILGRVASGTLQIAEDSKGLSFTCKLPDTSTARDLIALMERGDLSQMSFGFQMVEDDWQDVGGQLVRTLVQVVLFEISVVGQPAYTSTSVNLRSLPKKFRKRLKPTLDDIDDDDDLDGTDDDSDDEDRCDCQCAECLDGDCAACSDESCDDEDCTACPNQDDERSDRLRVRKLFAQRMN